MLSASDLRQDTVLLDPLVKPSEKTIEGLTFGKPDVSQPRVPPFLLDKSEDIIRAPVRGVNGAAPQGNRVLSTI